MKINIAHLAVTTLLCVLVTLVLIENYRSHRVLLENAILQSELELIKLEHPCGVPPVEKESVRSY